MKLKKIIFLVILIACLSSAISNPCKCAIKSFNEMTSQELIEYGRHLEQEEEKREAFAKKEIEEANKSFQENLKKDNIAKIYKVVFVILIVITILIAMFLITKYTKRNKTEYL